VSVLLANLAAATSPHLPADAPSSWSTPNSWPGLRWSAPATCPSMPTGSQVVDQRPGSDAWRAPIRRESPRRRRHHQKL